MSRTDIRIFVSCPKDCEPQRKIIKEVLDELNDAAAVDLGFNLCLIDWKNFAPGLGKNVQQWIDEQLGEYEILLGVMWLRFGTPVPGGAGSGTAHEVEKALDLYKRIGEPRVMFYFNKASPPDLDSVEPEEYLRVCKFRDKLEQAGLVGSFRDNEEFARRLRRHLREIMIACRGRSGRDPASVTKPDLVPYERFEEDFSEVLGARRLGPTGNLLHVVIGNLAKIEGMTPVLPINQNFDLNQRGPKSVLASFQDITVEGIPFYQALESSWPASRRPHAAGIGKSVLVKLADNSQILPGVIFTVTTKDLSTRPEHYGRYHNTPLQGVDVVLDGVLSVAVASGIQALAIPLLGAGYANIRRGANPTIIKQAALGITIAKLETALVQPAGNLERAVIVVFTKDETEIQALWETAIEVSGTPPNAKATQISGLLKQVTAGLESPVAEPTGG